MGPLWCGQGTIPHTTLSDLLSTDVLVSPAGAAVGAGEETVYKTHLNYIILMCCIAADKVLVAAVTVLLVLLPNTAVTLTIQWLPGSAESM